MAAEPDALLQAQRPAASGRDRAGLSADSLKKHALVLILIALVVASQALYPRFLEPQNILNILSQNAPLGIVAVGMTLVMLTGGFDLSVGAVFAAAATLYASLALAGWPLPIAFGATLLLGLTAGLLNGLLITRLEVNPFVATLGTMSAFTGLALIYSDSASFTVVSDGFSGLGRGAVAGLPISILILTGFLLAGQFVLSMTVWGRQLYAVGGNSEAARLAGLNVSRVRGATYVLCSACAAIGGMILASRLEMGQADLGGALALDAIAVVVIGGTSLSGGRGSVWQTCLGLLLIAILGNLLDSLAVDTNYQLVIKGVIVVAAVSLDSLSRAGR